MPSMDITAAESILRTLRGKPLDGTSTTGVTNAADLIRAIEHLVRELKTQDKRIEAIERSMRRS